MISYYKSCLEGLEYRADSVVVWQSAYCWVGDLIWQPLWLAETFGFQMQVSRSALIPWTTLANTLRNVGHILPGQLGQWLCSPLSDPLGQHGALTQRYQGRERPQCHSAHSSGWGRSERQLDLPLPPLGRRSRQWNLALLPRASQRHRLS